MINCVPNWYEKINLKNWMDNKKSYMVEWADHNDEHHFYQVYATNTMDAIKWCAWMHQMNCEIIAVNEVNNG